MKIILLILMFPFALAAQTAYPVVIDNVSSNGLKPLQAVLINSNEIASWYNTDFGQTYFGTTDINSHPLTSFKFDLNGFNTAVIKKGAKISSNKFLSLCYVTGNANLHQSYLFCHDKTGSIYWQKTLDNNLAGPDLEAMDLALIGDSLIGVVNQRASVYGGNFLLLDTTGNLLNSTYFTNFKATRIEPYKSESFWVSGTFNNAGTLDGKILVIKRDGTILKEFTLPQQEISSSFAQDSTLTFYAYDFSMNSTLSQMDTNGVIYSSQLPLNTAEVNFQDLIPFKNYYFQINYQNFQSGHFNALAKDSVLSIVDYAISQFVLPISDTNALLYSTGPFYGIKSSFNIPHVAITMIDTNFNFYNGISCSLMPFQKMPTTTTNLVINSANDLQTSSGSILINSTFTTSGASFTDSTSCMDFYGLLEENKIRSLSLYPNPANNHLIVDLSTIKIPELSIYNMDGQLLFTTSVKSSNPEINLSTLVPGLYILSGISESGMTYTSRFVKQ